MPAYRFEALDADGKTSSGLIDADNAKAVRAQLRARQLVPLDVQPVAQSSDAGKPGGNALKKRVFTATTLAIWTRQLAGLVSAGLPLERALTALGDEAEDPKQRELLAHLRAEVNAGSSFAQALSTVPREYDEIYRAVVAAGEQSGKLGLVLEKLSDDLEERQALKAKLIGAALYPAIVSCVAVVIVVFLVTYVVPQVASVFTGNKRSLPFLTVAMLAISSFMRNWGWLMLLVIGGAVGLLGMARRNPVTREKIDAAWLTLPLVGRLARGYN
ncbi:MAG: type II secretion system F family protein, partial [Leptothrix sp. (in: b-proteobacteria)]